LIPVNQEIVGIHSPTINQSQTGYPNNVGSQPGARGAQFIGVAIHHPQPNQHDKPCMIVSTHSNTPFTFSLILSRFEVRLHAKLLSSSESGIPSPSESLFILANCSDAYFSFSAVEPFTSLSI
jgi:hypothetical protein